MAKGAQDGLPVRNATEVDEKDPSPPLSPRFACGVRGKSTRARGRGPGARTPADGQSTKQQAADLRYEAGLCLIKHSPA